MKRFFLLGITLMVSAVMLMTACKKDETNNGNNDGTDAGYVNLGLPSGTKWKSTNETGGYNGFYTYDEAMSTFGNKLPSKEQLEELIDECTWVWQNNGYKVTGANGNSIVLPAEGLRSCSGEVSGTGVYGNYWSSTFEDEDYAYYLFFDPDEMDWYSYERCIGRSIRLVKK